MKETVELLAEPSSPPAPSSCRAPTPSPRRVLFAFTAPLASVIILQLLSRQIILGGLSWQAARSGLSAEFELAAFVVAFALAFLAASPVHGLGMLFLAYGDGRAVRRRLLIFASTLACVSTALLALLAFSRAGCWFIVHVQGLDVDLARHVQYALGPMVCWPALVAALVASNGILKRRGESGRLALANVAGLSITVGLVLAGPLWGLDPLRFALWAYLSGQGLRVLILLSVVIRGRPLEGRHGAPTRTQESQRQTRPPSWRRLILFYLPIGSNMLLMLASRPLIQWFLAQEIHPETALAGFGVAVGLSALFYGWLNELRTHAVAFRREPAVQASLAGFGGLLCLGTTALTALIFWTPLGRFLLEHAMHLKGAALAQASAAMAVMVLGPAVVSFRAYLQGLAIYHKRTESWLTSALTRVGAIALVMWLLPLFGVSGAVLGAWGLVGGFLAEALTLAWALRGSVPSLRLQTAVGPSRV